MTKGGEWRKGDTFRYWFGVFYRIENRVILLCGAYASCAIRIDLNVREGRLDIVFFKPHLLVSLLWHSTWHHHCSWLLTKQLKETKMSLIPTEIYVFFSNKTSLVLKKNSQINEERYRTIEFGSKLNEESIFIFTREEGVGGIEEGSKGGMSLRLMMIDLLLDVFRFVFWSSSIFSLS